MKIYLAGSVGKAELKQMQTEGNRYLLQTYYDMRAWKDSKVESYLNSCEEFLLDSGAFTFMNSGKKVNWKDYIDSYIEFVNKYDIKQFIELDLDHVVGVEETIRIRQYIEEKTGKQTIPVFHAIRGIDYYKQMCKEYDYIAIAASGIVKGIDEYVKNPKTLRQLLRIAHNNSCHVHGLAYTRLNNINNTTVPFDSVDSTAWLSGARYGTWYTYKNGHLLQRNMANRGIDRQTFNTNNLTCWMQVQKNKSKDDKEWIKNGN